MFSYASFGRLFWNNFTSVQVQQSSYTTSGPLCPTPIIELSRFFKARCSMNWTNWCRINYSHTHWFAHNFDRITVIQRDTQRYEFIYLASFVNILWTRDTLNRILKPFVDQIHISHGQKLNLKPQQRFQLIRPIYHLVVRTEFHSDVILNVVHI